MINLTDSGILSLYNRMEQRTDFYKLFWTKERGWLSKFMFPIQREVEQMTVDEDRIICDQRIYSSTG